MCPCVVIQPYHLLDSSPNAMVWRDAPLPEGQDYGWWEGWDSTTIKAVSDPLCSGQELRASTEAADGAWALAAGAEAEGFRHRDRKFSSCCLIIYCGKRAALPA